MVDHSSGQLLVGWPLKTRLRSQQTRERSTSVRESTRGSCRDEDEDLHTHHQHQLDDDHNENRAESLQASSIYFYLLSARKWICCCWHFMHKFTIKLQQVIYLLTFRSSCSTKLSLFVSIKQLFNNQTWWCWWWWWCNDKQQDKNKLSEPSNDR